MSGQCRRILGKPGKEAREYLESKILTYFQAKQAAHTLRRLVREHRQEAETESYQRRKAAAQAQAKAGSKPGEKPISTTEPLKGLSARAEPMKPESSADCQSQKSTARLQLAGRNKASRSWDNAVSVNSFNPVSSRTI